MASSHRQGGREDAGRNADGPPSRQGALEVLLLGRSLRANEGGVRGYGREGTDCADVLEGALVSGGRCGAASAWPGS